MGNRCLLGHLDLVSGLAKSLVKWLLVEEMRLTLHQSVGLLLAHVVLLRLVMVVDQINQLLHQTI